jgi:uncharacterized protein YggE
MRRLTIIISSFIALAAVAAVVQAGDAPAAAGDPTEGITVQGTASVSASPNRAQLWFGVESQGATARAALAANGAEMRKVLAALRAAGATDLQTQSVGLSPRYGQTPEGGSGEVQGFTASNSVSATLTQVGRAGAVIDAAVDAGANQVSGPSLTHANPADLYRQALRAAVGEARSSAQALAAASNLSLGRITAVVEGGAAPSPLFAAQRESDAGGSTPIEPGRREVSASVTVTFAAS